jgi:periplasmic nitrate reductase NapD
MDGGPEIDRRALMFGPAEPPQTHISSLIVHARPDMTGTVVDAINAIPGVEVQIQDGRGKLVVVLETATELAIVEHLNAIQTLPGVLSTALVFHHVETDS